MNKNFMVKDENGIDRQASVITTLENEGNKYLVYSIERDEENTNIFVSKINATTGSIENISDETEKNKIDELVKEVIKIPLV